MTAENQYTERKSLRVITGKTTDWPELAKDCVCFANSQGGTIWIGIEDNEVLPPARQMIPLERLDLVRKRIGELTVNVQVLPRIVTAENGGQFIEISISRAVGVASTSDGRYYLRVADTCQPVIGDDVLRLANERPGLPWESMKTDVVISRGIDRDKLDHFMEAIRTSERVKASVKDWGNAISWHRRCCVAVILTCRRL